MTALTSAAYDAIAENYTTFLDASPATPLERALFLALIGDVSGQRAIDVGCGHGQYARLLAGCGATDVLGVDQSSEMIGQARAISAQLGDDVQYRVADLAGLGPVGTFDLASACFVFNYARTRDELADMFEAVARNLRRGGRVIGLTTNPDFLLSRGDARPYGIHVRGQDDIGQAFRLDVSFLGKETSPVSFYQWSRCDYLDAAQSAGFRALAWHPTEVDQAMRAAFPPGFWEVYERNCLQIGFTCQR